MRVKIEVFRPPQELRTMTALALTSIYIDAKLST